MSTSTRSNIPADNLGSFVTRARPVVNANGTLRLELGNLSCDVDGELALNILTLVQAAASDRAVECAILPSELSTGEAADLLGVSRPTVVAMIEKQILPAIRVSTHRRLKTTDVLAYREHKRLERSAALDKMADVSAELGLYDD